MRIPTHRSQRGFTALEVMIVIIILATGMLGLGKAMRTAYGLAGDSQLMTQAHAEHRKNFEIIANVLRQADVNTLDGFVESGPPGEEVMTCANPRFDRVVGSNADGRVWGDTEELRWENAPSVNGVAQPGKLMLYRLAADGTELAKRKIGRNIPSGGFLLRQEGRTLVIKLTTYYVMPGREPHFVHSETAVSLRN